jgi:hypothetical protein
MEFQQLMIDVVRYLAAFTATESAADISAARQLLAGYAYKHGGASREFQALWDVTICLQRHIYRIGVPG